MERFALSLSLWLKRKVSWLLLSFPDLAAFHPYSCLLNLYDNLDKKTFGDHGSGLAGDGGMEILPGHSLGGGVLTVGHGAQMIVKVSVASGMAAKQT